MPNVLINVPEEMLERVEHEVQERMAKKVVHRPTAAEQLEAVRIAKSKGVKAANKYLASVRPPRVSRVRIILDAIERGLPKKKK